MRKIANAAVALLLTAGIPATAAPPPLPWKDAAPQPKAPLYLVRAGNDQIATLKDSIDRFTAKALETDYPLTLANAPGAPHGFDNQVDSIRTHEIVLGTLQFLRGRLGLDRAAAPGDGGATGRK